MHKKIGPGKTSFANRRKIDSLHPYVINQWALLNRLLGNNAEALRLMEKYKESEGPMYPCWYNDYGMIF